MKVSEVIKRLEELKNEIGYDCDVDMYMEETDGNNTGVDEINEIEISTDGNGENPAIYIAHREFDLLDY